MLKSWPLILDFGKYIEKESRRMMSKKIEELILGLVASKGMKRKRRGYLGLVTSLGMKFGTRKVGEDRKELVWFSLSSETGSTRMNWFYNAGWKPN